MITLVIIGILSATSLPFYRAYYQRARTAEAKNALGEMRQAQLYYYEDIMLGNNNFASSIDALGWTLHSGTTIGKSPAYFTYTTDDTRGQAHTIFSDTVPDGQQHIYIKLRIGDFEFAAD